MLTLSRITLILAATSTALMAGLFYSWSVSVMPGIARLQDAAFIHAMKEMNKAILNPVFFMCFFGAALLLPVSTFLYYGHPVTLRFWLLLGATLCYLVGVMGVTVAGNVPLNDSLEAFKVEAASIPEITAKRAGFEGLWNKLNTVRSLSATGAIVLVVMACLCREER